jgi:penicillin-binding protein 1A
VPTAEEIENRREALMALIRDGDRYQAIRPKYLDAVSDRVQKRYEFELRDVPTLSACSPKIASRVLSAKCTRQPVSLPLSRLPLTGASCRGPEWPEIKNQYRALQVAIKKVYDTKTRMKVFTWNNPRLEKDTVMTLLDSVRYHRMFLQTRHHWPWTRRRAK